MQQAHSHQPKRLLSSMPQIISQRQTAHKRQSKIWRRRSCSLSSQQFVNISKNLIHHYQTHN